MNRQITLLTVCVLAAALFALGVVAILESSKPKQIELCNDGWSVETKDNKIIETYVPELDTCRKENK